MYKFKQLRLRKDKSIVKLFIPSVTYCHGNLFAFVFEHFTIYFTKVFFNFNYSMFACLKVARKKITDLGLSKNFPPTPKGLIVPRTSTD